MLLMLRVVIPYVGFVDVDVDEKRFIRHLLLMGTK